MAEINHSGDNQARVKVAIAGAAMSEDIPWSNFFRRFSIQLTGLTDAQAIVVSGSVDGAAFTALPTTPITPGNTVAATGSWLMFELPTNLPGGIRVAVAGNLLVGTMVVRMEGNVQARKQPNHG